MPKKTEILDVAPPPQVVLQEPKEAPKSEQFPELRSYQCIYCGQRFINVEQKPTICADRNCPSRKKK